VGLAGQRGQRGGHLGEAGADVSRRGADLAAAKIDLSYFPRKGVEGYRSLVSDHPVV
jgi:hypothetical protein